MMNAAQKARFLLLRWQVGAILPLPYAIAVHTTHNSVHTKHHMPATVENIQWQHHKMDRVTSSEMGGEKVGASQYPAEDCGCSSCIHHHTY